MLFNALFSMERLIGSKLIPRHSKFRYSSPTSHLKIVYLVSLTLEKRPCFGNVK